MPPIPSCSRSDLRPAVLLSYRGICLLVAVLLLFIAAGAAAGATHLQSDWSGGAGEAGPLLAWSDRFDDAAQVSWLSVPGQIVLSSFPITAAGGFVTDTAPSCQTVAAADLDGDGDVDLMTALPLTSSQGTGKVRWYENAGDGENWTEHEVDDDFYGGYAVTAADLDGDGDIDIIASAFYDFAPNDRNGRYVWYENSDSHAGAWIKHFIAGNFWGTEMVAVADIDNDQDLDVYGASTLTYIGNTNDDIYWFENVDGEGTSWTQHAVDQNFPDAIEAVARDIDQDGDLDITCVAYGTHDLAWWENVNGDGVAWDKHLISDFTVQDVAIDLGDLDADGDVDIAAGGNNSVNVAWWENIDGQGQVWVSHVIGALSQVKDIEIADLDGDGLLDVLAADGDIDSSTVLWFRNVVGGDSWVPQLVAEGHDQGEAAISADLNGDGALEVVFTEQGSFAGDISGLHRRTITGFQGSGELDSAVLDTGGPAIFSTIDWTATAPSSTDLAFQVRSSNDPGELGSWSADITSPGSLAEILDPGTRYVQYKVIMSSSDSAVSPKVLDLSIETEIATGVPWDGSIAAGAGIFLSAPQPNPTRGASTVTFVLGAPAVARLDVFDVQGRRLATPLTAMLESGAHQVELPAFPSGVYLVRVNSGTQFSAKKLIVVR